MNSSNSLWKVGEYATLQWEMSGSNLAKWSTVCAVKVVGVKENQITVRAAPEHKTMLPPLIFLSKLWPEFMEIEWHFNHDGKQIPGTKFKFNARLLKLVDHKNN